MTSWIAWLLLGIGSFFCLTGALGMLRLPSFFTRLHGAGMLDSFGAMAILIGLALLSGINLVSVKLLLILVLLWITGPTATHALARAAMHGGLQPKRD